MTLIQTLTTRFEQEGVLYCHWKSKSLADEQDADLLIAIPSFARATEILAQLGFKAGSPRWGANPQGVFHFYGYDPEQDDFVHLHVFTRVLTGGKFLKNHLFPFEEMMFKNTSKVDDLVVTSREAELVVFILKTFIRYGSWSDMFRMFKTEKKTREDALRLKEGSNLDEALVLLDQYCPSVEANLFRACLNAILNKSSFAKKLWLSFKIQRQLKQFRKHSFPVWILEHVQLLKETLAKKIRRQKGSKILVSGGAVISVVGADATGKSTLVSETSRWLRKTFVVRTVHAGKPPATLATYPLKPMLAVFRRISKRQNKSTNDAVKSYHADSQATNNKIGNLSALTYAIRAVGLAWDRRALLWKVRRSVANGEIVVTDRYPTNIAGLMDSPRLLEDSTQKGLIASLYNRLARVERNLYRQIPPPDIVLRLRVSLEIAKQRNASREVNDDEIYLEKRHQQTGAWAMPGTRSIQDIDTDPPLAEVLLAVKQAVWRSL